MARRAVVEQEEVFEAATRMSSEGKPVTALNLKDALGGGSLTTIYKYLAAWEANRPKNTQPANSAEIPDAVQSAFANTWRIAALEASREVIAAKEKAAEEVKAAQGKFEEALEAIQRLENDSERDSATIDELKARIAELEQLVSSLGQDNAAVKATSEQLSHQVKTQQLELDRLHKEHQQDRQDYKEQIEKLSSDHANALNKATNQIDRLQQDKEAIQKRAEELERERLAAQLKFEQSATQLEVAEKAREHSNAEREKAIQEAAHLRGQLDAEKSRVEKLLGESEGKKTS